MSNITTIKGYLKRPHSYSTNRKYNHLSVAVGWGIFFKLTNERSSNDTSPVVFLRQFKKYKRTETNLKNSLVGNLEKEKKKN